MKFNVLKNKIKVCEGNPCMLSRYTNEEIIEFYNKLGYDVEIKRE